MARRIVLRSPLSPVALASKLRDVLGDTDAAPRAGVCGHGSEEDMMLFVYRPDFRNGFATRLVATMDADGTGTRITGRIGTPTGVILFMLFWMAFVSLFLAGAGFAAWAGAPFGFWAIFGGVPLGMMVFGGYLWRFGMRTTRPDEATILKFLADTVQATEAR